MKPISEIRRLKLAKFLKTHGTTQTALAGAMGIGNPSIINQHVRGTKNIGEKFARRYEEALDLPSFYLDTESDLPLPSDSHLKLVHPGKYQVVDRVAETQYLLVPPLSVTGSSTQGWHSETLKGGAAQFPLARALAETFGVDDDAAALLTVPDGAMSPVLEANDFLIVDYQALDVISGKVYALMVGDEMVVRRLFKTPDGGLKISADNVDKARYPDWEVASDKIANVHVVARVVGVVGAVR